MGIITIADEHVKQLDDAVKAVRRADLDAAAARVKLAAAQLHQTETMESLAAIYDFDPSANLSFDAHKKTIQIGQQA